MMERIVINNGVKIQYDVSRQDNKITLVFLHGGGGSMTAWEIMLPLFKDDKFSFITVDLRGHGLSDRPNEVKDYTLENHAEDILSILNKENRQKVILIGHCLGSMVAATFAAIYPQRVKKLILINTNDKIPWFINWVPMKQLLNLFLNTVKCLFPFKTIPKKGADYSRFIGSFDIDFRRLKADLGVMGVYAAVRQGLALLEWDSKKYFPRIKTPTLVIASTRDLLFPRGSGEAVIRLIGNAKLEYVDSNHISIINNPRKVYNEIARFLG